MWHKKIKAFTLLECLVALLVISGSVLVFEGLTQLASHDIQAQTKNLEADWLVFADQLRTELDGTTLDRIENNRLYVDKSGQSLAFGKSTADDFRKTNGDGRGYQPMIFELKSCQISQKQDLVRLDLTFENGMERSFLYDFTPTR